MSKELEALNRLKTAPTFMGGTIEYQTCTKSETLLMQDYEIIKQALLELQSIKEAEPSEALKCLEDLYCEPEDYRSNDRAKDYEYVKQALLKAEKEHKALEIIKEKNVSVCGFRNRVFGYHSNMTINDTYEYYLNYFGCYHNGFDVELLTKEEFNLLKEVLE